MSTTPVRFGILGAGRVARDFAAGLAAVPGAQLAAVWSRTDATAASFVAAFPGVRRVSSDEALVADTGVDVVYVATPHHRHAEDCLRALRGGKAVLVEKPFATSAAEGEEVAKEARERNLFCMEAMWMRFIPVVRKARSLVESGAIGEPKLLAADFGFATAYDASSRFFDPAQGGGALLDRGVYGVSLAHYLFGAPESVVGLSVPAPSGVDESAGAVLRFSGGRLAVISASLTSTTSNEAVISGTRGRIRLTPPFYASERLTVTRFEAAAPGPEQTAGLRNRTVATVKQSVVGREALRLIKPLVRRPTVVRGRLSANGYEYEAQEVVRCLAAGLTESPLMPLDESVGVLRTLDELKR